MLGQRAQGGDVGDAVIDYVAAEYAHPPTEDDDLAFAAACCSFATEAAALAWVAQDPERRRYRGAQRRLPFGGETGVKCEEPEVVTPPALLDSGT